MTTLPGIVARWVLQMEPHGPVGTHGGHGSGVMPWGGAGGTGFGFVWPFLGLLVVIAAVLAGTYLVLTLLRDQDPRDGTDDVMAVLRQRYARGEIDEEEFEERTSRLSTGDTG